MVDALKTWLRDKLGVIMDFAPEMFGRYTRDGTLLAHILCSYDVINSDQMNTIIHTYDPALSRVNLRTLRIWLKLINVDLCDEEIECISKGKGTVSLQLFYKVYLSLEDKDQLDFIALQKEQEKHIPIHNRFVVTPVREGPSPRQFLEHPLSKPLIEATDTIVWHRNKFWKIVEACKRERARFKTDVKYPVIEPVEHFIPEMLSDKRKEESEKLDEFTRKHSVHRTKKKKKYQTIECCPEKKIFHAPVIEDPLAATKYIHSLKRRNEKAVKFHEEKLKVQISMITESWMELLRKQDKIFDEALGRRVLDQSRYERQIMTRLCEVRDVKNRIVENRRIVDNMLLNIKENELRLEEDRQCKIAVREAEDIQTEARRISELRQRLCKEKIRRLEEKHRKICMEILRDLVDIAMKAAEYRQTNNNYIPPFMWSEWRTLFINNQPISELNDNIEMLEIEEDENTAENTGERNKIDNEKDGKMTDEMEDKRKNMIFLKELERQRCLADGDFENYRDFLSPWNEYLPEMKQRDDEVVRLGSIVLGYIVHHLLQVLYPYSTEMLICPVPRVKIAAIILGITDPAWHQQLQELLTKSGIRLLRMENAINYCLARYKQEMADVEYIDLNIIAATTRDMKKLEVKNKMKFNSRNNRSKKIEKRKVTNGGDEKQTQTPRQIPYDDMDPVLSDAAYIGKWAYEFLTLGQPISNELNTKILIEYLKGIEDVPGWALINYPNTYEQMAMLEKALTGHEVPPDRKIIDFTELNIEDIDPPSPRIVFENGQDDAFAICRQSRLLPNPIPKTTDQSPSTTFMTIYIKAMPKSKMLDAQKQHYMQRQPLPVDTTSLDDYYTNQDIAYRFYYNVLNFATLKKLARLIMGEHMSKRKSSLELFGEISPVNNRKQKASIDINDVVIQHLTYKVQSTEHEEKESIEIENHDQQAEVETSLTDRHVKPGEIDWQWIDFPQPLLLLKALAILWENIEEAYIENLKETLSLKRIQSSAIVPYRNLILKNLKRFIDRPDKRQDLLQTFHRIFNDVDDDLREDSDMKCELHCRVIDFRAELWELCDARRSENEKERERLLQNQWTLVEAVILVNVYTEILQTEIDRFIDTMQLLQDYYTSMLQRRVQETRFSKLILNCIDVERHFPAMKQETINKVSIRNNDKSAKIEAESTKVPVLDKDLINIDLFKTEIINLFTDVSKSFDLNESDIYNVIIDNIRQVRSVVDSVTATMTETLMKEEKSAKDSEIETKYKRTGNISILMARHQDLVEEWRYAVLFEIDRICLRLDLLGAAARSDVTFLLDTIREVFHNIHHYITERYKREIESIDNMANVFFLAIEEAKSIQEELLLDDDRFVVKPDVLMFPEDPKQLISPITEAISPLQFRMVSLGRLIDIFKQIAPNGTISERGLVYILQDLVSCNEEECYPPSVPCSWRQLRPPDIVKLIEQLFNSIEYIEWREFILYAMDLPIPSHEDILRARNAFKIHDPESREVVTHRQYCLTPLWFLKSVETSIPDAQSDYEASYKTVLNNQKKYRDNNCNTIMDIMLQEEARLGRRIIDDPRLKNAVIETNEDSSRAQLVRLMLAKELLYQMYLTNGQTVNYIAMLLAFCKDEDPREGLGKAFTLAMGVRVCTNITEGERYVEEFLEEKRRARKANLRQDYIREEVNEIAQDIIDYMINKVMEKNVAERRELYDEYSSLEPRVMIERLDSSGKIDPFNALTIEEKSEHLVIEEPVTIKSNYEYKQPIEPIVSEDYGQIKKDEKVIYWLPREICLTVLSTCLPWHASQADLFQTSLSLREWITHVYNELRDEELNNTEDIVLAHRLVNHDFISKLLFSSGKFVSKNMGNLLCNILNRDGRF